MLRVVLEEACFSAGRGVGDAVTGPRTNEGSNPAGPGSICKDLDFFFL